MIWYDDDDYGDGDGIDSDDNIYSDVYVNYENVGRSVMVTIVMMMIVMLMMRPSIYLYLFILLCI